MKEQHIYERTYKDYLSRVADIDLKFAIYDDLFKSMEIASRMESYEEARILGEMLDYYYSYVIF